MDIRLTKTEDWMLLKQARGLRFSPRCCFDGLLAGFENEEQPNEEGCGISG